jgi:HK97 family phage prohead protease
MPESNDPTGVSLDLSGFDSGRSGTGPPIVRGGRPRAAFGRSQLEVELRSAPIEAVDYPQRSIELVAIPWDTWAQVEHQGRIIEESVAPGAFGRIHERRSSNRLTRVNLEHDRDRWIGRVEQVDGRDPVGLRAVLRIRRTPEGDQALMDAADGMYAASVGMAVRPTDEQWDAKRSRRRILRAFLDHIALTGTPAYEQQGAIAVRSAPPPSTSMTPNLDAILAERAAQEYGRG